MALLVSDIMVKNVVCVRDDMELDELVRHFKKHSIRGFPVLDNRGSLVGIVSTSDLIFRSAAFGSEAKVESSYRQELHKGEDITQLIEELEVDKISYLKVRDIMSATVVSVASETPVTELAEIMRSKRIHRVLVLDGEKIAGLVGTLDMLGAVADGRLS